MRKSLRSLFSTVAHPDRELERRMGYRFRDRALLEAALIHRSYRFENPGISVDNQRLEFLGDAVLGMLTAAELYRRFGDKDEGGLTTLRSQLTSGLALGRIARGIASPAWRMRWKRSWAPPMSTGACAPANGFSASCSRPRSRRWTTTCGRAIPRGGCRSTASGAGRAARAIASAARARHMPPCSRPRRWRETA